MNSELYNILLEAAKVLKGIPIPPEILERRYDIPETNWPMRANWVFQGLFERYEKSERDPLMKAIFGPMLKIRVALHNTEFTYRQRAQWEAWYLGEYLISKHWKPDAVINKEKKTAFIADPHLWGPILLED